MHALRHRSWSFFAFLSSLQQFGKILDVEIIFNERGSKVRDPLSDYIFLFVFFQHHQRPSKLCKNTTRSLKLQLAL